MRGKMHFHLRVMFVLVSMALSCPSVRAAREAKGNRDTGTDAYATGQMLKKAVEFLDMGEEDRGVKMLEAVIEQNAQDPVRFRAYLALGRYYLEKRENAKAIESLRLVTQLKKRSEELSREDREMYLEALYLSGVAHFNARKYEAVFSDLRKITSNYPNTTWANQAYYYIGMSHFAMSRWSKAIANLELVGTFIDPDAPEIEYVEAGHRFYVKIEDKDIPVMMRQNREMTVRVAAKSGDTETIVCIPQPGASTIAIGSIPTEVGKGQPGDGLLSIIGGDTIEVTYVDDSTQAGEKDVARIKTVKVASTASLSFTRSVHALKADSAFLNQPFYLRLKDADLDTTEGMDTVQVKVVSMTVKREEEEEPLPDNTVNISDLLKEDTEKDNVIVRDEVMVTLTEVSVHGGLFTGSARIVPALDDGEADKTDAFLTARVGDKIVASYEDSLTVRGPGAVLTKSELTVYDEINTAPSASQDVVTEAVLRATKELVEAEALLAIADIFQAMGLKKGAREKAAEGLDKVGFAIETGAAIPKALREKAFSIKWNLYIAQDELAKAMATCTFFSELYPDSSLVNSALMGFGRIYLKQLDYENAIKVFQHVSQMDKGPAAAEAQFSIAQTYEIMTRGGKPVPNREINAVAAYKVCATRFPESEFAGPSLAKVVDYQIRSKDFAAAEDLLNQIFLDYQDEDFLDKMLLKWVIVAKEMGDYQKAAEKCRALLFEYPGSLRAATAQAELARIEEILGATREGAEETSE